MYPFYIVNSTLCFGHRCRQAAQNVSVSAGTQKSEGLVSGTVALSLVTAPLGVHLHRFDVPEPEGIRKNPNEYLNRCAKKRALGCEKYLPGYC